MAVFGKTSSSIYLQSDFALKNFKNNMNIDYLLEEAIIYATQFAEDYQPPQPLTADIKVMNIVVDNPHSQQILDLLLPKLAGNLSEEDLLNIERQVFIELVKKPETLEKIAKFC